MKAALGITLILLATFALLLPGVQQLTVFDYYHGLLNILFSAIGLFIGFLLIRE